MKRAILNILFGIYVIIAIFVTVCLLSYNNYKVTEFGDYSLVIISDEFVSENFKKGDLVIVNKKEPINIGQKAFFYNTYNTEIEVRLGEVIEKEPITEKEITYTLEGERKISSQYVIGPESPATIISGVGSVLGILESKWGFLFIIVLPALLAFIHQIGVVVSEIRGSKEEDKENKEKDNKNDKGK